MHSIEVFLVVLLFVLLAKHLVGHLQVGRHLRCIEIILNVVIN